MPRLDNTVGGLPNLHADNGNLEGSGGAQLTEFIDFRAWFSKPGTW